MENNFLTWTERSSSCCLCEWVLSTKRSFATAEPFRYRFLKNNLQRQFSKLDRNVDFNKSLESPVWPNEGGIYGQMINFWSDKLFPNNLHFLTEVFANEGIKNWIQNRAEPHKADGDSLVIITRFQNLKSLNI